MCAIPKIDVCSYLLVCKTMRSSEPTPKKVNYSELDTDVQSLTRYLYIYKVKRLFACTASPAPLFGKQHVILFSNNNPCEEVLLMDPFNTLETSV